MSQHIFHTQYKNDQITVLMGWDRPLQGYFMVIQKKVNKTDDFIYSNLDDPHLAESGGFASTIEPFVKKLNELGIEVPLEMFDLVKLDGVFNAGNKQVFYSAEGRIA
jgi:hypothetical protein